jgi:hypothetical protein
VGLPLITTGFSPFRKVRPSADKFVERLYRDGQANNRYQLYGYSRHAEDLLKLDQLVFHIRQLCQPLEVHFLGDKHEGVPDQSRRERMLRDYPSSSNLSCKLEETLNGKCDAALRHALSNWNFPFVGVNYPHDEMTYTYASQNPVLVRRPCDPLEAGPAHFQEADETVELGKGQHLSSERVDCRD